ncbi:uncharacterized protein LOC117323278 [Pecten maximus]|uniref:uncharacterized protein LOC117323278 n=1 Tax=Pecten maximus TaxID=6579 RepID=UPI001458AF0B|nr:uncharacterized protein LOC117323278 [Pecten maximus]
MCERFNRTVLNMLGTLDPDLKGDWKKHVGPLVHAYNSTRHEQTGYSPFYLMFGRRPRLPVDLAFGIERKEKSSSPCKYVDELRTRLKSAYDVATRSADKARGRQKENYDRRIRGSSILCGDRVLVKKLVHEGKHKLDNKWEDTVYVVEKQENNEIPVFTVRPETGTGRTRKLHRNLLLPVGELFSQESGDVDPDPVIPKPRLRRNRSRDTVEKVVINGDDHGPAADLVSTSSSAEGARDVGMDTGVSSDVDDDPLPDETEGGSGADDDQNSTAEDHQMSPRRVLNSSEGEEVAPVSAKHRGPDHERPVPVPRKTIRRHQPPTWQTSGEFAMRQTPVTPDWMSRASYLQELAKEGNLDRMPERILDSLLTIVSGST